MHAQLLIVDDELETRELLRKSFSDAGHDVTVATDGVEALERLEQMGADVVISDIEMPKMDGVELLRRVRQEFPMTRVIMITGPVSQSSVLSCMRLGAETCIFKPFVDLSELDAAVAQALRTIRRWSNVLTELHTMKPGPRRS